MAAKEINPPTGIRMIPTMICGTGFPSSARKSRRVRLYNSFSSLNKCTPYYDGVISGITYIYRCVYIHNAQVAERSQEGSNVLSEVTTRSYGTFFISSVAIYWHSTNAW